MRRTFKQLPALEKRIAQEFGAEMEDGVKINAQLIVGFERGCYESWCQDWTVKLYPDTCKITDKDTVECQIWAARGNCLEDAITEVLDLLKRYRQIPRQKILEYVESRPNKQLWGWDIANLEKAVGIDSGRI